MIFPMKLVNIGLFLKYQWWVIFFIAAMRETWFFGLLILVKVKQQLPLKSPLAYCLIVRFQLSIKTAFILTFEKSDALSENILHIVVILSYRSLM